MSRQLTIEYMQLSNTRYTSVEVELLAPGLRDPPLGQVAVHLGLLVPVQRRAQRAERLRQVRARVAHLVEVLPPEVGGVQLVIRRHLE